ncbi:septum formation initiator family protein [Acetobacteraceae bacterium]|nr:septum formation initiator family protein [Candidatus Parcubacteria bacterium]
MRGAWNMYGRFATASLERQASEQELAALEARNAQVAAAVGNLSSERGVEAEVRERYGVAKPGEGKIEIIRDEGEVESGGDIPTENIFMRAWHAIFRW